MLQGYVDGFLGELQTTENAKKGRGNAYRIVIRKYEGKRLLGRSRSKWRESTKK
jgi:hypothetical protein